MSSEASGAPDPEVPTPAPWGRFPRSPASQRPAGRGLPWVCPGRVQVRSGQWEPRWQAGPGRGCARASGSPSLFRSLSFSFGALAGSCCQVRSWVGGGARPPPPPGQFLTAGPKRAGRSAPAPARPASDPPSFHGTSRRCPRGAGGSGWGLRSRRASARRGALRGCLCPAVREQGPARWGARVRSWAPLQEVRRVLQEAGSRPASLGGVGGTCAPASLRSRCEARRASRCARPCPRGAFRLLLHSSHSRFIPRVQPRPRPASTPGRGPLHLE